MDGKNLILLSRSPDCLALLNRLGIKRINDILKFQDLLGAMRADVGCSHGPATSLSGGGTSSQSAKRKSRVINNQSPLPIVLDFQTLSPQANVSSTNHPSSEQQQQQQLGTTSPITSSTTSSSTAQYSTVYATNSYDGVNDKTLINWQ